MTNARFRLPSGGRIDRGRPVGFSFDGRHYTGYAGDTLASALLAHGVRLVGRSFKYHRPRGVVTDGVEEPNALVQLGTGAAGEPNARATQVEIHDGLSAASQNCWPSVTFDAWAVNGLLAALLPAGFYYKTFMWPEKWWMRYEYFIRQAAGLGRAPTGPDPDAYDKSWAHCDVLVVGAGPSGLAAAHAAGRTGARVLLVDERPEPGGHLFGTRQLIDDAPANEWVAAMVSDLVGDGRGPDPSARHRHRLLRSQLPHGARTAHRPSFLSRATGPGPPAAVEGEGAAGRPRRRGARAPARVQEQRPPGRDARVGGPELRQPVRGASRIGRGRVHQQRHRVRAGARPRRRGAFG